MLSIRQCLTTRRPTALVKALFSTSTPLFSNIGSAPILVPQGTTLKLLDKNMDEVQAIRAELNQLRQGKPKINLTKQLQVTGPRGKLCVDLANFIDVNFDSNKAIISVQNPEQKHQRSMWGTSRSLISNAVSGVSEGHMCIVKLVGTGFRAQLENVNEGEQRLVLRVGFSVPRIAQIPPQIKVSVPVPHRIIIEGCDKQQVMLLAAQIRSFRKPEPYKGKGIFINDESIKLKQKKIK